MTKEKSASTLQDPSPISEKKYDAKDWGKTTITLKKEHLEKIQAYAFFEKKDVSDIFDEIISTGLELKKISAPKERIGLLKDILDKKTSDCST